MLCIAPKSVNIAEKERPQRDGFSPACRSPEVERDPPLPQSLEQWPRRLRGHSGGCLSTEVRRKVLPEGGGLRYFKKARLLRKAHLSVERYISFFTQKFIFAYCVAYVIFS